MLRHPLFPHLTTTRSRFFSNWRMNRSPATEAWFATLLATVLALCIASHPRPSHAGMHEEIDHLLLTIETSTCSFKRNAKIHDGQEAGEHIRKKFTHTRRWVKSTEDFIRYTATQSSMSGKPYQVTCDGVEMPTAEWLTEELTRFREKIR